MRQAILTGSLREDNILYRMQYYKNKTLYNIMLLEYLDINSSREQSREREELTGLRVGLADSVVEMYLLVFGEVVTSHKPLLTLITLKPLLTYNTPQLQSVRPLLLLCLSSNNHCPTDTGKVCLCRAM